DVVIRRIESRLVALDFRVTRPADSLPGPEPDTEAAIVRFFFNDGAPPETYTLSLHDALPIYLRGERPGWRRSQLVDALMVYPPSDAIGERDDFLSDREERIRCNFPYVVPIAPDAFIKENISGGMWYNLNVPAVADDPPLNGEP